MEQKTNVLDVEQSPLKGWLYAILILVGGAIVYGALIGFTNTIYWYIVFVFPVLAMYVFIRYNRKQAVAGAIVIAVLSVLLNFIGLLLGDTLGVMAVLAESEIEASFGECFPVVIEVLFGESVIYTILTIVVSLVGAGVGIGYGNSLIKQMERKQQAMTEQAQAEQQAKEQTTVSEQSESKTVEAEASSIIDKIKSKKENE